MTVKREDVLVELFYQISDPLGIFRNGLLAPAVGNGFLAER